MIQILDTYAYLCFNADNYCSINSQYKLHLDQTAMTFAFYCSLMVSLLSTTMLQWFPCPKMDTSAQRIIEDEEDKNQKATEGQQGQCYQNNEEDKFQSQSQTRDPLWPGHGPVKYMQPSTWKNELK